MTEEADDEPDERRDDDEDERLGPAGDDDGAKARFRHGRAGVPPNSACDELVGSPKYHVIRFQVMAPMRPVRITV